MLCAEVALMKLAFVDSIAVTDLRLVRLDDYLAYGFDILVAMMEQDKKVYPAEKADDMLGFLKKTAELEEAAEPDYDDDGNEIPSTEPPEPKSRFEINVWNYRAWCHWAVGCGVEEGWIM